MLTAIIDGQDDTRRRLSSIAREPDFAELERIRSEPVRTRYCVEPDCRSVETVPMDTDMATVRCLKHRRTGEPQYQRDPDYRPYTGGPVAEW